MNPHFRYLVDEAKKSNKTVIDRCNLTIFYEQGYDWLPEYLAKNHVQVVASLPCYTLDNVEKQVRYGTVPTIRTHDTIAWQRCFRQEHSRTSMAQ
jgi:hypothetical protein